MLQLRLGAHSRGSRASIMRVLVFVIALMLSVSSVHTDPLKAAVFDFELLDTSLQGEVNGPQVDEQRRLKYVTEQLRKALAGARKIFSPHIPPLTSPPHPTTPHTCSSPPL